MLRLKAERLRRGLTQAEVAQLAGLYAADVSRLERGGPAYRGHLERVANVLRVPLGQATKDVTTEVRILDGESAT